MTVVIAGRDEWIKRRRHLHTDRVGTKVLDLLKPEIDIAFKLNYVFKKGR